MIAKSVLSKVISSQKHENPDHHASHKAAMSDLNCKIAAISRINGDDEQAIDFYKEAIRDSECDKESQLALSRLYLSKGMVRYVNSNF